MIDIGTPLSNTATRVLLCGGGELGKEVVIELQRLGVERLLSSIAMKMPLQCRWHTGVMWFRCSMVMP